jgi:hypothetical protein
VKRVAACRVRLWREAPGRANVGAEMSLNRNRLERANSCRQFGPQPHPAAQKIRDGERSGRCQGARNGYKALASESPRLASASTRRKCTGAAHTTPLARRVNGVDTALAPVIPSERADRSRRYGWCLVNVSDMLRSGLSSGKPLMGVSGRVGSAASTELTRFAAPALPLPASRENRPPLGGA